MSINPITAAQLYGAARPATRPDTTGGAAETLGNPQGGAAAALGDAARGFAEILQAGEQTAKAAMNGNADLPALVEALAKSELAVETAVTIRDKVVEAYQEILRMPV
ncbi:MAG: flagellar hook-basal body complex protein FliE [Rhodobacteraceae bacterium]|nr:flagellar hook-basal body complex protein FliE [Paracoccaceae bacterium]